MKGSNKIVKVAASVVACILIAFSAQAANPAKKAPSPKQQAQYEKTRTCSAEAKNKAPKGDESKTLMKEGLKKQS